MVQRTRTETINEWFCDRCGDKAHEKCGVCGCDVCSNCTLTISVPHGHSFITVCFVCIKARFDTKGWGDLVLKQFNMMPPAWMLAKEAK